MGSKIPGIPWDPMGFAFPSPRPSLWARVGFSVRTISYFFLCWDTLEKTSKNEIHDPLLRRVFPVFRAMDDEVGKERRFLFGCQLCREEGEHPFKVDDCHSRNLQCHPDHSLSKRRKTMSSSPTPTEQSSLFDSPIWRNMRKAEGSIETKDKGRIQSCKNTVLWRKGTETSKTLLHPQQRGHSLSCR